MLLERHDQRVEIGQHLGAAQFTLLDPVGTDPVRHQHAQQEARGEDESDQDERELGAEAHAVHHEDGGSEEEVHRVSVL